MKNIGKFIRVVFKRRKQTFGIEIVKSEIQLV
jgi:hypothetical protein